ncbi:kinase [Oceanisphaera profunda]|uniref:Kinase n=1 Tax=Oceanisphaera profunda TaxID=1416627 RepID=A0A1Y0D828_9GAMM|nr:kinase [Oceanisphaera profunda]ART83424.1 kinase [Oceanisphaera profunda]
MTQLHQVFDSYEEEKWLAPELARGGEGAVYPLQDRPNVLVKCYHKDYLQKSGSAQLENKVSAMQSVAALRNWPGVSWPLVSVYDQQQQWLGYAMRRAVGVPMHLMAHPMLYQKHFPNLDRRKIVSYLINYLQQVQALHCHQVMLGDYNLQNVLCDPHSDKVTLIDCDSYQLELNGQLYPCPVGSADMTAKEHLGIAFNQIRRTPESEAFSMAIILFKCLMLGRHPYDIVGGADPVSNLQQGNFAYGIGNKGVPKGPWYNIWSHMPHRIKSLFIATFTEGAGQPNKRPTLAEWEKSLAIYANEIDKGWHENAIKPAAPKGRDYQGDSQRIIQL